MRPNKNERFVQDGLIPARVMWLCACVRKWAHHESGVECVHNSPSPVSFCNKSLTWEAILEFITIKLLPEFHDLSLQAH